MVVTTVRNAVNVGGFIVTIMRLVVMAGFLRVGAVMSLGVMTVTRYVIGLIVKTALTLTVKIAKSRKA